MYFYYAILRLLLIVVIKDFRQGNFPLVLLPGKNQGISLVSGGSKLLLMLGLHSSNWHVLHWQRIFCSLFDVCIIMKIDRQKHVTFLKRKVRELNKMFLHELRQGRSSLQKLQDISYVLGTLKKEIKGLERGLN